MTALSTRDFGLDNGYSNEFWGWGGEDDDLYLRVKDKNLNVTHPKSAQWGRYFALSHERALPNPDRFMVLNRSTELRQNDGLKNIQFETISLLFEPLYTHILVDLRNMKNMSSNTLH